MKRTFYTLAVVLALAPAPGQCATRLMTVCDVFKQAERIEGEVVWLSGIYVTGPTADSGFTDYQCPGVRISMSFAREPEREKVTAKFREATSYLYHYNVALRLQARAIVLWNDRSEAHIELDRVYSFQPATGDWW